MTQSKPSPRFHGLVMKGLTIRDADAAQNLILQAGWNQVREDWEFMIANGKAYGLFDASKLVATALVLPHGDTFAWISMVLVDNDWRRKGLATGLLGHCVGVTSDMGLVPVLDATEAGRPIYQPLGFEDIYTLSRFQGPDTSIVADEVDVDENWTLHTLTKLQLDELAAWDAKRFGASRDMLLRALWRRSHEFAQIAIASNGSMAGYVLGRNGRLATQIGPIVATDEKIALSLLKRAAAHDDGPRIIDIPDRHRKLHNWLEQAGFKRQRGFTRMALERSEPFDRPGEIFAIAGPELG
ncbi:MAG: GNAT family N-acetyltransferase [Fimbriimonadaceae bacterium]|nr:GNAT family N-acetyltransferase [Alphaproteobacteria bacterium]